MILSSDNVLILFATFIRQFMRSQAELIRAFRSLAPISEVYSSQSLYLGNKIEYTGFIRRDSSLLAAWLPRYFEIKVIDCQRLELAISKSKQSPPEETLSISQFKLTKKCTAIQNYPCFGLVLQNGKKYLLSLKNLHECQKFHAQMTYIKKMARQLLKVENSRRQESIINNQSKQKKEQTTKVCDSGKQITEEDEEFSESEESQRINKRYQRKERYSTENQEDCQDIFETNLREESTSIYVEDLLQRQCDCENFFTEDQKQLVFSNHKFVPYPGSDRQKILVNDQNKIKATVVFDNSFSLHTCLRRFLDLSSWNQQIKRMRVLDASELSYVVYIEFIKNLTANQPRCAIAQVSTSENEYCAMVRVKSVKRSHSEFMSSKKEIQMDLVAKFTIDPSNKRQKVLTLGLSFKPSKEQFELGIKFLKEIKNFQSKFISLI